MSGASQSLKSGHKADWQSRVPLPHHQDVPATHSTDHWVMIFSDLHIFPPPMEFASEFLQEACTSRLFSPT